MKPNNIIAKISKNIKKVKWECSVDECTENSINSHLIQQNGILKNISNDNHFYELEMTDANLWQKKKIKPFEFKKKGIKHALSYPLFCSKHDSEIFTPIESKNTDFYSYETFLLFSYRTLCSEIRKKQITVKTYERMLGASGLIGFLKKDEYEASIKGNQQGIEDLIKMKNELLKEISNLEGNFEYYTYSYPKIDIYASAIFSGNDIHKDKEDSHMDIFIHILPLESELLISIGYNKLYFNNEMKEFCESWADLKNNQLKEKLSTLFYKNVENWGLSEELYNSLKRENINIYLKKVIEEASNFGVSEENDFNLFEQ